MAQKKKKTSSARSGSSGKTQPTSTARLPGGTKKNTASSSGRSGGGTGKNTSRSASSRGTNARSASSKNTGSKNAGRQKRTKPIRREVGSLVLLFIGIVGVIGWFPAEGWLVDAYRALIRGLFGWGYFIMPAALLWGAYLLGFHRGRPVALRLTCVLLLPLVFGAFIHVILYADRLFISGFWRGIQDLWDYGQKLAYHCGGVLSGLLGFVFRKALSVYGATIVLIAAFLLLLIEGLNLSLPAIAAKVKEWLNTRPLLFYEPEDDEDFDDLIDDDDDRLDPEDYLFPLDGSTPIRRRDRKKAGGTDPKEKGGAPAGEENYPRVSRSRFYDENWEERKDRIFAAMEIDENAKLRVAALVQEERQAARAKREENARSGKKRTASEGVRGTSGVKPLDLAAAGAIAGVEVQSADMDEGAASPAGPEKLSRSDAAEGFAAVQEEIRQTEAEDKPEYVFPPVELLNQSKPGDYSGGSTEDGEEQLEAAIRSYGVGATITGAIRGPSITRYELKLDQGVKLNKITNLAGDVALSLGVESVRIAPIPDKISTVGVEVPNRDRATVWLGDLIDTDKFRASKSKLSVAMGKDIGGNVIVGDIAKMPHVLIAGTTGSGKSVCVNTMILSILYESTPDEVRMIMIDPKMVEFVVYNGMPHLYVPVVTDPKKAAGALQWAVVEMLKRYRLFSESGVRDITGYNAYLRGIGEPILPQVVIFIDELADLMMIAAKEVEESICRVAQMGRAAGMHLVVATQSPRADVITGLMKANIPSRIALSVASSLESRIILDQQGAESLVGNGDMLFAPIGRKPIRVQGAFVSDEEREEIIQFVKQSAEATYSDEILEAIDKAAAEKSEKGGEAEAAEPDQNDYDELLPQAVEVIFETKQASVSMLQRRLKLGYSRAARLIDQLEEVGVVGPYVGSKPRDIIITKQQWQEMQYAQGTAPVDRITDEFSRLTDDDTFAAANLADGEFAASDDPDEEEPEDGDAPWEEDGP